MIPVGEINNATSVTELKVEHPVTAGETCQIDLAIQGPVTDAKAGVLALTFLDSTGNSIEVPDWPHHSSMFGEYLYLRAKQDQPRRTTLLVTAPVEATQLRLTGHAWSDYQGLQVLAPPRITPCNEVARKVNEPMGGEITTGIALAAVQSRHHVPFDMDAVQIEIPLQGNLRPVQQLLYLRFFAEDDTALSTSEGTATDATVIEIPVQTHTGRWKVQSDDIPLPSNATHLRLSGPIPSHDTNPVTLTRLPGLHWKRVAEAATDAT